MEIKAACLTSSLLSRLGDGLKSFSNIQQVTITDPTDVTALPRLTNIQCWKFLGLPRKCKNWTWLRSAQILQDIEVSFRGTESSEEAERIHVKGNKATFSHTVTPMTIDIVHNLPPYMQNEVNKNV